MPSLLIPATYFFSFLLQWYCTSRGRLQSSALYNKNENTILYTHMIRELLRFEREFVN